MSDIVPISGLWKGKTKTGKTYLSGSQGGARWMVFENEHTEGNQPTHTLCVAKNKKPGERSEDLPVQAPTNDNAGLPF